LLLIVNVSVVIANRCVDVARRNIARARHRGRLAISTVPSKDTVWNFRFA
jgi:hypothetical protein